MMIMEVIKVVKYDRRSERGITQVEIKRCGI